MRLFKALDLSLNTGSPEIAISNQLLENLPPIGVFWDIENCSVPSGRSAVAVVQRIREKFFKGHREAEFICVCDISKENKEVIEELNNCQVLTQKDSGEWGGEIRQLLDLLCLIFSGNIIFLPLPTP